MTLQEYQERSAYMLRQRRSFQRYTPDDWRNKGKGKATVETESTEEEEVEEVEEPEPQPSPEIEIEPEQFIIRRKLRAKRVGEGVVEVELDVELVNLWWLV